MLNKEIYIEDLVEKYPELVIPLKNQGIICIACGEPVWGTLGELMDRKELKNQDEIIANLNNYIKGKLNES